MLLRKQEPSFPVRADGLLLSQEHENSPPPPCRRVEIRILASDPAQEGGDVRMGAQSLGGGIMPPQFLVGEGGVDRAVTDGMNRRGFAAAPAFGHRMMPFHAPAKGAGAQETGQAGFAVHDWVSVPIAA